MGDLKNATEEKKKKNSPHPFQYEGKNAIEMQPRKMYS